MKPWIEENSARFLELPQCPHLHRKTRTCMDACRRVGAIVGVSGPMCNLTCRKWGPNLGRTLGEAASLYWTEFLFHRHYQRSCDRSFIEKITLANRRSAVVVPPKNLVLLRQTLEPLKNRPEVLSVCATGSIIVKGLKNPRDIDLVVVVADLPAFLDSFDEIRSLIPKEIGGVKTDIYYKIDHSDFFVSVDLWSLEMHASALYSRARPGPGIAGVVHSPDSFGYCEALNRLYQRTKEHGTRFPWMPPEAVARMGTAKNENGLGDMVSRFIKTVSFGKIPECGGCAKRRSWLNRMGRRLGIG